MTTFPVSTNHHSGQHSEGKLEVGLGCKTSFDFNYCKIRTDAVVGRRSLRARMLKIEESASRHLSSPHRRLARRSTP